MLTKTYTYYIFVYMYIYICIRCGIPQGSILAALLLSLYINDLNCAIRYCSIPHFVDDTNLLNYKSSVELMNKEVNQRLGKFNKLAECN